MADGMLLYIFGEFDENQDVYGEIVSVNFACANDFCCWLENIFIGDLMFRHESFDIFG